MKEEQKISVSFTPGGSSFDGIKVHLTGSGFALGGFFIMLGLMSIAQAL